MPGRTPFTTSYDDSGLVRENHVEVNRVRLFVRMEGSGFPLIFLHGGPGSSHDYFLPYVSDLASQRKIVLYDQRGCGKSQRLAKSSDYDVNCFVEELDELRRLLGIERMDLFGHSSGGYIAQLYALKHSENLRNLVLCCTSSNTAGADLRLRKAWKNQSPGIKRMVQVYSRSRNRRGQPYPSEYVKAIEDTRKTSNPKVYPKKTDQYVRMIFAGISWPVYHHLLGGGVFEFKIDGELRKFDTRPMLPKIRAKTLIIAAKYDRFSKDESLELHKLIPNSEIVFFNHSTHWPFLEENRKFIRVLDHFLDT